MAELFQTNADPALVELFRAEADMHIPALSQGLLVLEKGDADEQTIASMMRAAHSVKGAARIVGIDAAVRLAHIMEDCFTAAKTNRAILSSDAVDGLLRGVDGLQRICELRQDADLTEGWLKSLVEELTAIKEGKSTRTSANRPEFPQTEVMRVAARPLTANVEPIELPAQFDDAAAASLRGRLWDLLAKGPVEVRLEFQAVKTVSAGALCLLATLARDAGGMEPAQAIRARGIAEPVAALLRVSGLDRTLVKE